MNKTFKTIEEAYEQGRIDAVGFAHALSQKSLESHIQERIDKVADEYNSKILDLLPYLLALEHAGIYAQSVKGGENPYEQRSERMEGHNEAVMKCYEVASRIGQWLETIEPKEIRYKIADLLHKEDLFLFWGKDKKIRLSVNCNDLFYWACSDAEEITIEELDGFLNCYQKSPEYGGLLWCCQKRKMRPQSAYYDLIPKEEWVLFDGAGEERTDPDGRRTNGS